LTTRERRRTVVPACCGAAAIGRYVLPHANRCLEDDWMIQRRMPQMEEAAQYFTVMFMVDTVLREL
jgi:hypothetical protein